MKLGTTFIGLLLSLMIAGPIVYFIIKFKITEKKIQRKIKSLCDSYNINSSEYHAFKNYHFVIDSLGKKVLYVQLNKTTVEKHLLMEAGSINCCELSIDSYRSPSKTDVIREVAIDITDFKNQQQHMLLYTEASGDSLTALDTKKNAEKVVRQINSILYKNDVLNRPA